MKWKERRKVLKEVKKIIELRDLKQEEVCFTASTAVGMPGVLGVMELDGYRLAIVSMPAPKVGNIKKDRIESLTDRVDGLEFTVGNLVADKKPGFVLRKETE